MVPAGRLDTTTAESSRTRPSRRRDAAWEEVRSSICAVGISRRPGRAGQHLCSGRPTALRGGLRSSERMRRPGGIHHIEEPPLEQADIGRDYDVLQVLGEGRFAQVLLVRHRPTSCTVVLKAVHVELARLADFYRELHYSYRLSAHPAILSCYAVAFRTRRSFVFAQEHAPLGDLAANVHSGGLGEVRSKHVARQLASALDFVHSQALVHGDMKLENVLVFAADMSRIKLCDFGSTRRSGTLVSRTSTGCAWQPFLPPEVCEAVDGERYACRASADCWQLGVVLHVCLTGCNPWSLADAVRDPRYACYARWQARRTTRLPLQFRNYSARLLRLLRRLLEPKEDKRAGAGEVAKYLDDTWLLGKTTTVTAATHDDRPCSKEAGMDRKLLTKRVWEWLMTCDGSADPGIEGV